MARFTAIADAVIESSSRRTITASQRTTTGRVNAASAGSSEVCAMRPNALQMVRCASPGDLACYIQIDGSHRPLNACTCQSGEGWECAIDAHACKWLQANPDFGDRFSRRTRSQVDPESEKSIVPVESFLARGWVKPKRSYTRRKTPEGMREPRKAQENPDTTCAASGLLPLYESQGA